MFSKVKGNTNSNYSKANVINYPRKIGLYGHHNYYKHFLFVISIKQELKQSFIYEIYIIFSMSNLEHI